MRIIITLEEGASIDRYPTVIGCVDTHGLGELHRQIEALVQEALFFELPEHFLEGGSHTESYRMTVVDRDLSNALKCHEVKWTDLSAGVEKLNELRDLVKKASPLMTTAEG